MGRAGSCLLVPLEPQEPQEAARAGKEEASLSPA